MRPDVSVLLPYRDAASTLDEALESVLLERAIAIEVVCIDDGSTDGSSELVTRWARKDPRIVMGATGGRGLVAAHELARSLARAPLLARMDADDVSLPGRFEKQRAMLDADGSLCAVGTRVVAFPDEVVGDGLRRYVAWQNTLLTPIEHAHGMFVEQPLCHPSMMLRADLVGSVGGYRETPWAEDYDLVMRLHAAGHAFAKHPDVLLRWRHHDARTTFRDPRYALERMRDLRAAYLAPRLRTEALAGRAYWIWGAGPTGRRLARALEDHGLRAAAFVDIDPRKIGRTTRGAPIVNEAALTNATPRPMVLVAVGSHEARALVRDHLVARAFREGTDFVCCA